MTFSGLTPPCTTFLKDELKGHFIILKKLFLSSKKIGFYFTNNKLQMMLRLLKPDPGPPWCDKQGLSAERFPPKSPFLTII